MLSNVARIVKNYSSGVLCRLYACSPASCLQRFSRQSVCRQPVEFIG